MSRFDRGTLRVAGTLAFAAIASNSTLATVTKNTDPHKRTKPKSAQTRSTKPTRDTAKPNALLEPREANDLADAEKNGQYTSVIVVITGCKVERSMSPRLRRANGTDIWTGGNASRDYVIEHGIVSYAKSMDEALKLERVGARPLIITATSRHENAFRSDPILSQPDEQQLLDAEKTCGFLKRFRVVFVID